MGNGGNYSDVDRRRRYEHGCRSETSSHTRVVTGVGGDDAQDRGSTIRSPCRLQGLLRHPPSVGDTWRVSTTVVPGTSIVVVSGVDGHDCSETQGGWTWVVCVGVGVNRETR